MPSRTEAHDAGPGTTGNSPTAPGTDAVRRRRPEEGRTGGRRPNKTARRAPTRKGFVRMRVEGGPVGESEGRWGPQVPEAGKTRERAGEYPEGHEGNPERAKGKSGRHRSNTRKEPVQNRERGGTRGISDTGANWGGANRVTTCFFLTIPNKSSPEGSDGGRALPFFVPHARPCRGPAFLRPLFHFHASLPSIFGLSLFPFLRSPSLHSVPPPRFCAPPFSASLPSRFCARHTSIPHPPSPFCMRRRSILLAFPRSIPASFHPPFAPTAFSLLAHLQPRTPLFRLNVRPLFVSLSLL